MTGHLTSHTSHRAPRTGPLPVVSAAPRRAARFVRAHHGVHDLVAGASHLFLVLGLLYLLTRVPPVLLLAALGWLLATALVVAALAWLLGLGARPAGTPPPHRPPRSDHARPATPPTPEGTPTWPTTT